ncbi:MULTISPECIES: 1-acyl-sn-glycerol-3-phosphate acyltransferase [unclassified Crossiella]|uniref:lysophospholipid acyltransferase family protein n=1 Tax=unclassified Crossiella TaxID=2620835 RepID=UPI001FFFA5BC|nr:MULTISPECIES: lysophospholipid acyltransferase family protein [unclassified Crossiella]MCK2243176.1 1-acyl-sn-glycerol-3-phosphate acyltransferase [Crossiella sp. S99.2]MCK2254355.1 1-acyl-sn-glycerol-3-phosphate acyltransferase [Crossiella sp. S99.1]
MVALHSVPDEPTRRSAPARRSSRLWRALMAADRALVALTGKLVVTGEVPAELRGRPVLLASNHIGVFDGFVLVAACHKAGLAPSLMSTGGIFDAPIAGWVWRRCGHVRVDRGKRTVTQAMDSAVQALGDGHSLLIYPEGRVTRDPGLWPERGKTGAARIALAAGVPVVPVSQFGAHEAVIWGTLVVSGWTDFKPLMMSWFRAVKNRPTFRVHFGAPPDLSDLSPAKPGDAARARDRIMREIAKGMIGIRPGELDKLKFHDATRPTESRSPWTPDQL